jgi:large subunit ribosomal protein L24
MKLFSKFWKSSKKPSKQRKYRYNAPLHIRRKLVSVNLSKELQKKYDRRNIPVKTGDKVKVMRGEFRGVTGAIKSVDLKKLKVSVNGIEKTKRDGTKIFPKVDPSNLIITDLNLEDKKRLKEKKNG